MGYQRAAIWLVNSYVVDENFNGLLVIVLYDEVCSLDLKFHQSVPPHRGFFGHLRYG